MQFNPKSLIRFSPDPDSNGGGNPDPEGQAAKDPKDSKDPQKGPKDEGGSKDGGDEPGGDEEPETAPEKGKTFTQAEVDALIQKRLDRERKKADKSKSDAEAEALEKNEEWQKLAEKRGAQVTELEASLNAANAELEGLKETHARYEAALKAHLKTQRDGLPAHVLALLDELDPVKQLEYISKHAKDLKAPKKEGVPASPNPADKKQLTQADKESAKKHASYFYRRSF